MSDEPAFFDADDLPDAAEALDLAATIGALIRADLVGDDPGAVLRALAAATTPAKREQLALAWTDAMGTGALRAWIDDDRSLRARAEELVMRVAPPDPGARESAIALALARDFGAWDEHAFAAIVVPGYTPTNAKPAPGVHEVARRRLAEARSAFDEGQAPFVLLSGGNVHPRGTTFYEAIEMKKVIVAMGVPAERVIVDARARHSTTNLRNAGRFVRTHGQRRALVVTLGGGIGGSDVFGQDFYFANAGLSTFHGRCERELGYRVGDLDEIGEHRIELIPSAEVTRIGFHDALDP